MKAAKDINISNLQREILTLFSTDLSESDLLELKSLLSKFYAEKAIKMADQIWEKEGYTDELMQKWLAGEEEIQSNS